MNGSFSEPWSEQAGVRQGSVSGPLLFNLLFDSVAAAVRAACPGVALGDGPNAPRVTSLVYADDLVILALLCGSQFLDAASLRLLDQKARQFGRACSCGLGAPQVQLSWVSWDGPPCRLKCDACNSACLGG